MRIIIVGAGKLGYKLAESLSQEENDVIVIDIDSEVLERVNENLDVLTIKANGAQLQALEQLHINNCDLIIAVTGSDETNILVSVTAKKIGCKKAIARIRNPEYANQVDFIKSQMGIDYIVNPELATAKEIAKVLLKNQGIYMEDFAKGKVAMVDFRVENLLWVAGKKIKDLNMTGPLLVVAIARNGEMIIPYGDTEILSTDTIYVMGQKESINEFSKIHGAPTETKPVKKVMILGGGKSAYYLANKLTYNGVDIKIIEQDKERCKALAECLSSGLVIHGDGTDINLLVEENISDMDAFVALTGFDEDNLLITLLAKQYRVNKVIAKVSRPNYIPIIERLGIDIAINPILITAGEILRFIQGGKVISISLLLGGKAEVLEIIAHHESKIVGKKLANLGLPKGIIIGSIVHENKIIIPDGNSIIQPGDRVIVFCLQSEVASLEKYFYRAKGGLINELWHGCKGIRKSTSI
ncbi:Trk system potassium transporter TrkA [Natronincola ferrireducens]|uniref:Trk system potassium uptake protein TrkA n=1 Tax=Natronincola ferrireducens TaxID=393762 RepID=A0A1G8YRT9_9FIRM|nr:Trk system potassium transporter TrkA [Natronincola ferrireducens]SDK04740.1 trk system potassium uptake protein TrkA [Natronincola ferrireducens]